MEQWLLKVVACPECKGAVAREGEALICSRCGVAYPIEGGIPTLLAPELREALRLGLAPVKGFYLQERYDWTRDPKGLECIYHRWRRWTTRRLLDKALRPGDLVLDVGCGTGLITRQVHRRSPKTLALDLNRWALLRCGGNPHPVAMQGDAEALPIQDSSVDLLIATEVIEHLESPARAASEIFRVCKQGGRCVGSVPTTSKVWKLRRHLTLTCAANEPLHRSFRKAEIKGLWRRAGFKVTALRGGCLGLNWFWTAEKP